MATATLGLSASYASAAAAPKRNGMLARLYNALMEARMRQAMRELAMRRHPWPQETKIKPLDVVPRDEFKRADYRATFPDAGLLPSVR
jgi:hypothetical protein